MALVAAPALAAEAPPAQYADYVAAVRKADAISDPLQRCLAYPDLPGNTWAPGLARARCTMFLTPPPFTVDQVEQTLAQPSGAATLDARFRELLEAHYTVPAQREQVFTAFWVFRGGDRDKAERVARAWLAASPDSPFARTALGHVLASRGWEARGSKYAQDTPEEDLERMSGFFVDATREYAAALEAEPKLLPACVGLMSIGRQSSDVVQAVATQRCMEADPASYYVVDELMTAAEPRWGGSPERMRSMAAYAQAHAKDNPVLAVFAFHHAWYDIDRADDGDPQALAVLEPAAAIVPNAAYMRAVGGAYLRKDDYWKAFVHLSQALRFSPDIAQESRWRAYVLFMLGEPEWARADAERAVRLDPDSGHAHRMLADILRDTVGPDAARPHYARAMEEPKLRENAFLSLCGVWIDGRHRSEAARCVDDLLREYPDNGEGWRQRLVVLGPNATGSVEAMKRFLETHDPERWPRHAAVAEGVRKLLAAKEAAGPAPEGFDARVERATKLEGTADGMAYLVKFHAGSKQAFQDVMTRCFNDGTPAATIEPFTLVADIRADGSIAAAEVHPANARSSCYAKGLAAIKGSPPPEAFAAEGFPMVIHISVRPGG